MSPGAETYQKAVRKKPSKPSKERKVLRKLDKAPTKPRSVKPSVLPHDSDEEKDHHALLVPRAPEWTYSASDQGVVYESVRASV